MPRGAALFLLLVVACGGGARSASAGSASPTARPPTPLQVASTGRGSADDPADAKASEPVTAPALAAYFGRLVDAGRFAGEVRVTRGDRLLWQARLGPVLGADGDPIDGPLRAPIGSITKDFVVALVGRLMQAHGLAIDAELGDLFPDAGAYGEVTVDEILRHRSRFPREPDGGRGAEDPVDVLVDRCLRSRPRPEGEIAGAPHYSNCAYLVLGHALTLRFRSSLSALLTEHVLDPLGLGQTGFDRGDPRPIAVSWRGGRFLPSAASPAPAPGERASGGLYSTVVDLDRFYRGARAPGFLSAETRRRLPQIDQHAGRVPGYMAYAGLSRGVGVFLLSVADDVPVHPVAADLVAAVADGRPLPERTWRWSGLPTPPDALGACTGRYVLLVDRGVRIDLEAGPSATIRQGRAESAFDLRLAADGELHFVAREDHGELLPFSVMLDTARDGCQRVKVRLNGGVPLDAQRLPE